MKKRNALPRIFVMIACIGIIFAITACEGPVGPKGDPGTDGAQGPAGTNGTNGIDGTGWLSEFPTALRGTWAAATGTWTINADTLSYERVSDSTTYALKLIACSSGVTTSEGTSYGVQRVCLSISGGSGTWTTVGEVSYSSFHIINSGTTLKFGSATAEYTKQ